MAIKTAVRQYCPSSHFAHFIDVPLLTLANLNISLYLQYTLETFTEGRSTAWAYEPFRGQPIDGPMNGPAPLPWDIPVHVSDKFMKKAQKLEVPHTASIKVIVI